MKLKRKEIFVILILIAITLAPGCFNDNEKDKYINAGKEFNRIYFETVESIDVKNAEKTLQELPSEKNKNSIEQLGVLLDEIRRTIPKDKEPHYSDFKQRYEDLKFLYESYSNDKALSLEDRRNIYRILVSIGSNKSDWKDKNSKTVWQ